MQRTSAAPRCLTMCRPRGLAPGSTAKAGPVYLSGGQFCFSARGKSGCIFMYVRVCMCVYVVVFFLFNKIGAFVSSGAKYGPCQYVHSYIPCAECVWARQWLQTTSRCGNLLERRPPLAPGVRSDPKATCSHVCQIQQSALAVFALPT